MFACEICGEEGLSEADMKTHLLLSHLENEIRCPICCLSGVTYDELLFHIDIAHSENNTELSETSARKEVKSGLDIEVVEASTSGHTDNTMEVSDPEGPQNSKHVVGMSQDAAHVLKDSFTWKENGLKIQDQGESTKVPQTPRETGMAASERVVSHAACTSEREHVAKECSGPQVKAKQKRIHSPKKERMYPCPMCSLVCADCYILQEHVELHLQEQHTEEEPCFTSKSILRGKIKKEDREGPTNHLQGVKTGEESMALQDPDGDEEPVELLGAYCSASDSANAKYTTSKSHAGKLYQCPFCSLIFRNSIILQEHVDLHLVENSMVAENAPSDLGLAMKLQEEEEIQRRKEEARREAEEFKKLQAQFGLDGSGGYKKQHVRNMERAVFRGQMTAVEFHRRKAEMMESLASGVDDGKTRTSGVIGALYEYYQREGRDTVHVWLCAETDHFHSSAGDKGWGCGYRNFQMLLSCLLKMDLYKDCLKCGAVPCIPRVQAMIEDAWREGADPQGAYHFNHKLQGSRAWIGATEIYSVLTSLRVKCRIVDFHRPSGPSDTHPRLFEWVRSYYSVATSRAARLPPRVVQTTRPPIYLQHQGHSRSIVGIEEKKNGSLCILIFDPGCPSEDMKRFLGNDLRPGNLRHLRRFPSGLKHKQYQLVAVEGVLSPEEKQVRLQSSRNLCAEKIP
nr:PREDICTED: zinc finger with UFM1-specific peptidase domain protein isoform X1 [Lepisosteus oculatus]XP_015211375.1 PREDICTED: zinc finger with UFM1-specific peptidase domain protein isoform X1 [Lepisosteus oculatus]